MSNKNNMIEKRETEFTNAKTFDAAASKVLQKCAGYSFYQHYSHLESILTKIIQKRWFLTRCSSKKMNDLQEPLKFDGGTGLLDRSYVACFGHGMTESVAMWGLYGKSSPFALRVTIPGNTLEKWMSDIEIQSGVKAQKGAVGLLNVKTTDGKAIPRGNICASVFRDMLYAAVGNKEKPDEFDIRRSKSLCWGNGYYHLKVDEDIYDGVVDGRYAGFIKDIEWRYEDETRLCIRLKKDIGEDNISIAIPPYVIEAMRFTFSPWLRKEEESAVKSVLEAALASTGIQVGKEFQRFRRSTLQGALNFK